MTNHFEAGGFVRSNEDVAYPNLMIHFLPIAIRYDGTACRLAATDTRSTSARCTLGRPRERCASAPRIRASPRSLRFNYLSTDQDRREWVEAIACARRHPGPAGLQAVRRWRALPRGQRRRDRRADPGLGTRAPARRRCTRRAPAAWEPTRWPWSTRESLRVHGLDGLRSRGCIRDADDHEREHLRTGDDDRREIRGRDPRSRSRFRPLRSAEACST